MLTISAEQIDVIDNNGLRTGEISERSAIKKDKTKYKRVIHFYLFDKQHRLLAQKRAMHVSSFPGSLGISVTGHIDAGEYSQQALIREVREEIGLDAAKMNIKFLFSYIVGSQFWDVYACIHDFKLSDIKIDPQEVESVQLIELEEFAARLKNEDDDFRKIYGTSANEVLYFMLKKQIFIN